MFDSLRAASRLTVMRLVGITGYRVAFAAAAQGFDGWRASISIRTQDPLTTIQVRFVDDVEAYADLQQVQEDGGSDVFLHIERFSAFYHVLQSERPLYITLLGPPANTAALHSGYEPAGEEESR